MKRRLSPHRNLSPKTKNSAVDKQVLWFTRILPIVTQTAVNNKGMLQIIMPSEILPQIRQK